MTEAQKKVIGFINQSPEKKRFLCEFEEVIPVAHNKRYEWMIRGGVLGKMVKAGIIKVKIARGRNRQYYYL